LARREAAFSQASEGRQFDSRKDAGMLAEAEKAIEETRQAAKSEMAKLASAEASFNDIRRNVAVAKEINLAKVSIAEFGKSLAALGFSEDDYSQAEEGIESLISDLSVFRDTLNGIQLMLRNSIIEDINLGINDIWSYAYPYSDYERVRLIGDEGSYSFEVFANGEWRDISVVASGGEKTIAAIALRVALAAVLAPQMGCIVLDEPTHNLDGNGIDRLSSLIKDRLPALVDQFVILREKSGNDPTSVEKVGYA
jgi:DNA repair exonuclease SbcCD ATPase subunit